MRLSLPALLMVACIPVWWLRPTRSEAGEPKRTPSKDFTTDEHLAMKRKAAYGYWGLDASGKPVVLLTDFGLFDHEGTIFRR